MEAAKISASAVEKTSELKELHNNIQKKLVEDHEIDVILEELEMSESVRKSMCLPQYQLDMPKLVETGEFYTNVLVNLSVVSAMCVTYNGTLIKFRRYYRPALSSLSSWIQFKFLKILTRSS